MAYTLPLENQTWPDVRVLWQQGFGAGSGAADNKAISGNGWQILPSQKRGLRQHGFYVLDWERVSFPMVGRATLAYQYGVFDDAVVDEAVLSALTGADIRIQVSPMGTEAWRTVYWGTIDYVEDRGSPGASTPRGTKLFHAVDGFYRAKRWPLDRHAYLVSGEGSGGDVKGHPGYNWSRNRGSVVAGNKGSSSSLNRVGVSVLQHTKSGAGTRWSDLEAINHALGVTKPAGEPHFILSGATDLLSGTNPWEVPEGETVHDFAMRVCKRERGRGLVYVDWNDDSGAPTGPLAVKLTVGAQLAASISYTNPSSEATVSIAGATSRGTTTTVDIVGDHRCVHDSLRLGDPDQFRLSYLETEGEPIEVLATLAYIDGQLGSGSNLDGTLSRRWSSTAQATFTALTGSNAVKRQEAVHRPVFQLHGLSAGWSGMAGNGNGGPLTPIDFRCTGAGRIVTPTTATYAEKDDPAVATGTSPLLVDVVPDTPLFEGYAYTGLTLVRSDGAAETGNPQRRRSIAYVRLASDRYLDVDQTSAGSISIAFDDDGIWLVHSGDEGTSSRYFSVSGQTGFVYAYSQLAITTCLRLPHRVRLASGDPRTNKRRGKIFVPGAHLWLASSGAIYDLNTATTSSGGYAGRRAALGASETIPGLLRDDRDGLAEIHALAWAWYGDDTAHRSAAWALRACGFLPSYEAHAGTEVPSDGSSPATVIYPTIGQVVTTLTANGSERLLNTPVTRVAYSNETGVTTWSTEWHELELLG